jgi:hypothetical protein
MLLCFIVVARAAVNRLEPFGMGKFLSSQIAVATSALNRSVRRGAQGGSIEGGRHSRLPLASARSGFVASQARLASRQRLGLLGAEGQSKEDSKEAHRAENDKKTLCASAGQTICPKPGRIIVEIHSTP